MLTGVFFGVVCGLLDSSLIIPCSSGVSSSFEFDYVAFVSFFSFLNSAGSLSCFLMKSSIPKKSITFLQINFSLNSLLLI